MTRADVENQKSAGVYSVRRDPRIKRMLLDLEQQIVTTIGNLSGFKEFTPSLVARARSDRELRDRARLGITARPG